MTAPKAAKDATDAKPAREARTATAVQDGGGRPALPYEQARDQLTELVKRLEAGGLTLEQSLELWERGEQLADICQQWLEGARARLTAATARAAAEPGDPAAPF